MSDEPKHYKGSCLCGAVAYDIEGPLRPVVGCHCVQCRKTSGHYVAATQGYGDRLKFSSDTGLSWYRSSDTAERGFCSTCGSSLFWRRLDNEMISICAGTLDGPTGLEMECHIHGEAAGDYYSLDDGLPQIEQAALATLVPEK